MDQKLILQEEKAKEKNKGGRPRSYNSIEEMQPLIDEYFEIKCHNKKIIYLKNGTKVEVPDPEPVHISGLCAYLGLTRETLCKYQERPEFSDSIKHAKQMCEEYAVDMCFKGKNKADFVLQNNFGWRNRSETENKTENTTKIIYIDKEEKEEYEKHIEAVVSGKES